MEEQKQQNKRQEEQQQQQPVGSAGHIVRRREIPLWGWLAVIAYMILVGNLMPSEYEGWALAAGWFALGLAIVVAIASAQTLLEENNGVGSIDALNNGYHLAFIIAAMMAAIAAIVAYVAIRKPNSSSGKEKKEEVVVAPTG